MTADPPVEERLLGKVCRPGASPAELEDIFKSSSLKRAALEGGVEWGKVEAGHSAVDDIVSAAELFRRLVREMEEARKRLDAADRRPPLGRPRSAGQPVMVMAYSGRAALPGRRLWWSCMGALDRSNTRRVSSIAYVRKWLRSS